MAKKLSIPSMRSSAVQQQAVFSQAADPLIQLETVELNGSSLEQLAKIVKEAHNSFESHLVSALQAALIAGKALTVAKQQFVYDRNVGGFRGWVSELGISRSTSYRYMDLAQHSEIVSQAETLSEATALLSQYKAEQRALRASKVTTNFIKRRTTLTLSKERDAKLESLAEAKGVEVSSLITEVLDRWLARQRDPQKIDVTRE